MAIAAAAAVSQALDGSCLSAGNREGAGTAGAEGIQWVGADDVGLLGHGKDSRFYSEQACPRYMWGPWQECK